MGRNVKSFDEYSNEEEYKMIVDKYAQQSSTFKLGKTGNEFSGKPHDAPILLEGIDRFQPYSKEYKYGRIIAVLEDKKKVGILESDLIKYAKKKYPFPVCKNKRETPNDNIAKTGEYKVYIVYNLASEAKETPAKKVTSTAKIATANKKVANKRSTTTGTKK